MTTTAIDLDMLNELLDNQKKLDDVFSLDDDFFGGSLFDDEPELSVQSESQDFHTYGELSFEPEDAFVVQKSRSIYFFIVPVIMEIVAIYFVVSYLF